MCGTRWVSLNLNSLLRQRVCNPASSGLCCSGAPKCPICTAGLSREQSEEQDEKVNEVRLAVASARGFLLGGSLAVPPILGATSPAGATVAPHVAVAPSSTPAFVPNASLWHRQPRLQLRGERRRGGPPDCVLRRLVLRLHDGERLPGNHIAALVSSSPNSGYGPYTHNCYGSTALPNPSPWEQANTQTSPGVFQYAGHWVMFYDASQSGNVADSGDDCLAVATAL